MPMPASSSPTTPRLPATAAAMRCGISPIAVTSLSGMAWATGRFGFSSRTMRAHLRDVPPPAVFTTSETRGT